ncbi:MAG: hypothetical protein V4633_22080 [Pseudomonadota bacterium]
MTLDQYIARQLDNMFPEGGYDADLALVAPLMEGAMQRMHPILASVGAFSPDAFNRFNSLQYTSLLYLVGNEEYRRNGHSVLASRLFYLNRALNAIDLFYAVELPEVFFISHGLGAVLGNATYGNRLVIFQNVTVGRVGQDRPTLGNNIVLYPGAVVTGNSRIGNNCVVSAGTVVHGMEMPDDTVAVRRGDGVQLFPRRKDFISNYLRPDAPG